MATDTHHVHSDHDQSGGCCGHADEIQSERVLVLYLLGGVLLVAAFLARTVFSSVVHENTVQFLTLIAAVALGGRMVWLAWKELMKGRASTGSLASLAIIASVAVGQYEAAGWLAAHPACGRSVPQPHQYLRKARH